MKTYPILAFALAFAAGAAAQHAGHSTEAPAGAPSLELVAACVEAQRQVSLLADQAIARLETARQSNSPREMRAAVADLQATLVEIRSRASECAPLEAEGKTELPR
jgi:hypothetical protein